MRPRGLELSSMSDPHDRESPGSLLRRQRLALGLTQEALAEARARGDIHAVAHGLRNWGRIRRLRGDTERAFAMLRESVILLVPFKDVCCAYTCLEDFAAALCGHDRSGTSRGYSVQRRRSAS